MSRRNKNKVSVYIDGFNIYHAVERLNSPEVKWINYWKLSESFLRNNETIEKVYLFTSLTPWGLDKKKRHKTFMDAQEAVGVTGA